MNREPQSTFDFFSDGPSDINQFRLCQIQLFNWGTFNGIVDFLIPRSGYAFLGPSGSGKSTVLDAHAAVLTPPKWVDFNVAARQDERHGKDRNLITYVRGAWSQQTGETGEYLSQYLRPETTWSAIAETYRDGTGRVVVLAQIFWIRGKSTAVGDVHKRYLILQRPFDIRELQFFADHNFEVRRFKFDLPDATVKEEFSSYQERFRQLLDIDNERALRLLHKTQSAKNLGDLNTFLRDFMLDAPETFELADNLVAQFQELNEAHKAVVEARRQIETLKPAQAESFLLDTAKRSKNELEALSLAIDAYSEREKKRLLTAAIHEQQVAIEGLQAQAQERETATRNALETLQGLQQKRLESGGGRIEQLNRDIKDAESLRDARIGKRNQAEGACQGIGWPYPNNATEFTARTDEARQELLGAKDWRAERLEETVELRQKLKKCEGDFAEIRLEIEAMEKHPSNIPSRLLAIREHMAKTLEIPEEKLPYAGELLEVKEEEREWQGAIERVLGGFARSLLVSDKHYAAVAAYLNEHNTGERLTYLRVIERSAEMRSIGANSLVSKLQFARGPLTEWLREELKAHFNYECIESLQAFRNATRAVTKEGQVKHNAIRHEKDDRRRIDDPTHWVLGFDNKAKRTLYERRALELATEHEKLRKALETHQECNEKREQRLMHCQTLANLQWNEVDVTSMLTRITSLQGQLKTELEAHPDLAALDEQIKNQAKLHEAEQHKQNECSANLLAKGSELEKLNVSMGGLRFELLAFSIAPQQMEALNQRFGDATRALTLTNLANAALQVVRGINNELQGLGQQINGHVRAIEERFQKFVSTWPAEAGGLDPTMASADDFFAKLRRLEQDGLPDFEERFLRLLREQSDQNLTRLSTQLDHERKAIRDRMDVVNESLESAPFGPGTHLVIDTNDRMLKDVIDFKQSLKDALSHSFSQDKETAEARFTVLNGLVKKLSSQETADRNWQALVLDVRQHVEFVARELDASGLEIEIYRSGAGKSGGQRQKLAATCLAAALRYQLGNHGRELPTFSTVVLDEAFDKADAEFTTMAMNIFKTFGFQMIVATPLKSVMTLEPFIGGACFIHIKDRKYSAAIAIDYDEESQRLKWKPEDGDGQEAPAA